MATYNQIFALKENAILREKVTVAVAKAAQDVMNEGEAAPDHEKRAIWAAGALREAEHMAEMMMWAVLGNAAIQAAGEAAPDGDVQYVVNGLINIFAGV